MITGTKTINRINSPDENFNTQFREKEISNPTIIEIE
jgi:hypothetical protein